MTAQNDIIIIIPSLEPDEKFLNLLENFREHGITEILVVNDGSSKEYNHYYETAKNKYNCRILKNAINLGKGCALKYAFNYILTECPQYIGAVTVDSDGQHTYEDTLKCMNALREHPDSLIMGCRNFTKENGIPFRSSFGNQLTRMVIQIICGIKVSDTQTGLRGFSRNLMEAFLNVDGCRFEYEMNMLVEAKEQNIPLLEVPIETIYIEENRTSHFNPVKDSLRIYKVFGKYILSSIASFLIDIVLFTLLVALLKERHILNYIIYATVCARIISSLFNYTVNKNNVFKSNSKNTLVKYYILCIIQMLLSALGVKVLFSIFNTNESILKILVDTILFIISFNVQREWVFKKGEN